jgi:flagellin
MRIQHNIMAMNAYRNYSNNTSALSKNLEKLSSGYKIKRAGDDAAGLAISEKLRAQISGLEQASNNVKDGISLVQTGEGALQEVQDMLNRMVTLAEESANGTYQDDVDRENLQSEMDALKEEINRIADSANFNGINLLDGSMASKASAEKIVATIAGVETAGAVSTNAGATFSQTLTVVTGTKGKEQSLDLNYVDKDGNFQTTSIKFTAGSTAAKSGSAAKAAVQKFFGNDYTVTASGGTLTIKAKEQGADLTHITSASQVDNGGVTKTLTVGNPTVGKDKTLSVTMASYSDVTKDNNYLAIDGQEFQIVTRGTDVDPGVKALYVDKSTGALDKDSVTQIVSQLKTYGINAKVNDTTDTTIDIVKGDATKGGLTLQIGDTSDTFNQMRVSISDMHTSALGIDGVSVADQASAATAIQSIKEAINYVSSTRGVLGATQNRLEHTSNNLSVMTENIQDAESTIRDTDVAEEMMSYTKNNILIQSAQAMLAQANTVPQGVLQLLQ